MIDKTTYRRRLLMETILQSVQAVWEANPGVCLLIGHIYRGLANSSVPPSEDEGRAAVAELTERGLIDVQDSPVGDMPGKCYRISQRGRDFVSHGYPWDLVDEFSADGRR